MRRSVNSVKDSYVTGDLYYLLYAVKDECGVMMIRMCSKTRVLRPYKCLRSQTRPDTGCAWSR